jgi:hypothetical protein
VADKSLKINDWGTKKILTGMLTIRNGEVTMGGVKGLTTLLIAEWFNRFNQQREYRQISELE